MSKSEALIASLVTRALKGDMRAMTQVLRLMEDQGDASSGEKGVTIHVIDQFDDPQ
ncbi:hypothetical protein HKCCE2091_21240 [Rhodobacterales bacterium HKCCE2091]|nr:hypothetical protein [Rhodobacterales bacterium HKCCE2091]